MEALPHVISDNGTDGDADEDPEKQGSDSSSGSEDVEANEPLSSSQPEGLGSPQAAAWDNLPMGSQLQPISLSSDSSSTSSSGFESGSVQDGSGCELGTQQGHDTIHAGENSDGIGGMSLAQRLSKHTAAVQPGDSPRKQNAKAACAATSAAMDGNALCGDSQLDALDARALDTQQQRYSCGVCSHAIKRDIMVCSACACAFHVECLAGQWKAAAANSALEDRVLSQGGASTSSQSTKLHKSTGRAASNSLPGDTSSGTGNGCGGGSSRFGLLPEHGECAVCGEKLRWMDLLASMRTVTSWGGRQGKTRKDKPKK